MKNSQNTYNWNLTDLFENKEVFHEAIRQVQTLLKQIETYKGILCDSADNLYQCYHLYETILMQFDKLFCIMSDEEKRKLVELLIDEIQIYEERQSNGQWIKSMKFNLPIIEENYAFGLDKNEHVESLISLSRVS